MQWFILLIAGLFEVTWAIGLKLSNGFTNLTISILTVCGMIASFYFLAISLKNIPLGTAYAVWTGIGTIGTIIFGIFIFREPVTIMRMTCLSFIILGITGLKLLSN